MNTPLPTVDAFCEGVCRTCPSVGSCSERIVCRCLKVTEHEIITAIRTQEVRNLSELRELTEAGTGCNCCHKELKNYLTVYAMREVFVEVG